MKKVEQQRIIKLLMDHVDRGTNVDAGPVLKNPVASYTDAAVAKTEWQRFFQDYPQILGFSSDLPAPGSFFTSEELGKPILCTRDKTGIFRAFLNVCRHRGAVVEHEQRGRKNVFNCPFHAWGYSASGDLVSVPKQSHFGEIDKSCFGLVSLPAEERHGLLWVSANPEGRIDLDELLGGLGDELSEWDFAGAKREWDATYDTAMNWKLAIDTFGETYHFDALHKDTLAPGMYGNCQSYDTYERNHRMVLCHRGIDRMREVPPEYWHVLFAGIPVYYIFPNVQIILGMNGPTLVRVYPRGEDPNESYSEVAFYRKDYFPPEITEQREKRSPTERAAGFASVIQSEDYWVAASAHKGALSKAQDFVVFGRNEPALHHYHNTYREALGMPPLETLEAAS
ncbi:MAG: aromatic ring-hydroxylating dioxygenase subunit alpha [Pseudomonadota bacterium]|nr:aromatic ring-hydroxylating dioxygenase subunit alpha [Pseudomonadota bacterium]